MQPKAVQVRWRVWLSSSAQPAGLALNIARHAARLRPSSRRARRAWRGLRPWLLEGGTRAPRIRMTGRKTDSTQLSRFDVRFLVAGPAARGLAWARVSRFSQPANGSAACYLSIRASRGAIDRHRRRIQCRRVVHEGTEYSRSTSQRRCDHTRGPISATCACWMLHACIIVSVRSHRTHTPRRARSASAATASGAALPHRQRSSPQPLLQRPPTTMSQAGLQA